MNDLELVREWQRKEKWKIPGVAIAGISAIFAAARPDLFPVIDDFALTALCHHYDPAWLKSVARAGGKIQPDDKCYVPYTEFCRDEAAKLSSASGRSWTPRDIDMALWAIGKLLRDQGIVRSDCLTPRLSSGRTYL